MPRMLKWGAPQRKNRYEMPGLPGRRLLLGSLAAGGAIAVAVLLLHLAGLRRMASPGPLASAHAPLDARCEQCHARRTTLDLRCERCHDPAGSEAWRLSAHARFAGDVSSLPALTRAARQGMAQHPVTCAECHADHRGRGFQLARVSDRMCARCHGAETPSLAGHVEFALVRAKATPPRGLKISHDRHVLMALARVLGRARADELTPEEKEKGLAGAALQRTCETCHVSTSDLSGFEPLDFDRHCAACHLKDGSVGATDPVPAAHLVPLEETQAAWATGIPPGTFSTFRDKVTKTSLSHRDPWVLFNLARLRREVDPAGYLAERNQLLLAVDDATRIGRSFPLARAGAQELEAARASLEARVAALERRLAPGSGKPDAGALAAGLSRFADAGSAAGAAAGDEDVKGLLADLGARLAASPSPALTPLSDAEAAARRAELLSALDGLRQVAATRNDILLGRRVEELSRRVARWKAGASGAEDLRDELAAQRLERDRVVDEMAYRRVAPDEPVPPVSRLKDRRALEARARDARERLEALAAVDALPLAAADAGTQAMGGSADAAPHDPARAAMLTSADSLSVACQKCHDMANAALAPLAIDLPVMPQSFFDHRPHVRLKDCGFCHAQGRQGVLTSKKATDVLVPGVASCRTCHRPSEARADCATCHRFHPSGYPDRGDLRQPGTALVAGMSAPQGETSP